MPEIHPIYVFEVALAIDLDQAERALGAGSERQTFRHRGRATSFFQYRPAPLRITQEGTPIVVGEARTEPTIELVLYDFGAASVAYQVPVTGGLAELQRTGSALRQTDRLRLDARSRVEALLGSIGKAAQKPRVAEFMEDYTFVGMRELGPGETALAFCDRYSAEIARMLRPGGGGQSAEEIGEATGIRISFGPSDMTIIDWDAAFVLDPDPEDVRAVLEFANVQLLEMRWLDLQLDQAIERSYQLLRRTIGWRAFLPSSRTADLRQVAELQLESVVLLERVTNALKVFGEEYLTRIYRLAARRFRLEELDTSIERKLQTIESIYQKLADRAGSIRMEILEWVVIALIAVEIAISLSGH